jgi:hypothetical protein
MRKKKTEIPDDCMPKCGTCAFLQAKPGEPAGYCRRYPPVAMESEEGSYSAFPVVELVDWCGEYKRALQS